MDFDVETIKKLLEKQDPAPTAWTIRDKTTP